MNIILKVVIVGESPAAGMGIKAVLEQIGHVTVLDIVQNIEQATDLISIHHPQFVITGLSVPYFEDFRMIHTIKKTYSNLHIVTCIDEEDIYLYHDLLVAGVSGVIVKSSRPEQIKRLFHCIMNGETIIPLWLINEYRSRKPPNPIVGNEHYSDRDKRILDLVSNGFTNAEIATELHLSIRSIETNLSKIYKKLNVKSRAEAVKKCRDIGII
ncbi:response regulator transcription factor [Paenibacillus sp. OSY-SE]|uniref:response regulator transcription factor n=1 Tax=Paenibacillus sp. OSY-SE TaxID=1196323 RepID=UPI000307949B|nr:response regulator transcription factor [Paenibacillus sp. OSY-SE]